MQDKYEISLWEDYLVSSYKIEIDGVEKIIPEHYDERKLCIIGSDSITAPCRALEPQLVENINGTHTFTFKMYYTFKENNLEDIIYQFTTNSDVDLQNYNLYELVWKDIQCNGESYQNPFLPLLVNERKVKVLWKGEWYDFIIKNCKEDSNGKSITYTCTDLYINELSKTGFDVILDAELNNNSGTAVELAETILEGTDWRVDSDSSDIIRQEKEEPTYEVDIIKDWNVTNETANKPNIIISSGSKILVFYNEIQDFLNSGAEQKENMYTQFAYAPVYQCDTNTQRVINADCYSTTTTWKKTQHENVDCIQLGTDDTIYGYVYYKAGVSNNYRASRLVKSQLNKFDSLTGKYCNVWKAIDTDQGEYKGLISKDDLIYEYKTTVWDDALVVNNLVINSKDFTSTEGWIGNQNLTFQLYPSYTSSTDISTYSANSYLKLTGTSKGIDFYNDGLRQSSNYLPNGFSVGEKFIFRYKARSDNGGPTENYITSGITPLICTYQEEGEKKVVDIPQYFVIDESQAPIQTEDGWHEVRLICRKSATRSDLYSKKIGLFLRVTITCWLEEAQLFPEVYGANNTRINPGDMDVQSISTTKYVYYNYTKSRGLLDAADITPLWSSKDDWNYNNIEAVYNRPFEKVRSISAKQSNRFNLLQTIAETFECWVQFIIQHDSTGRIIYDTRACMPRKFVQFKRQIGRQTGIGFVYGIDLKTISRTIQSDQIVTKTIVSANNNECATNGFCTISRSEENYPRTTFLLNFDYYISQGLIDGAVLNHDLYDSTGDIGYFYNLHQYNTEYDSLTAEIAAKQSQLTKQLSYKTVYDNTITSLQENIQNIRAELINMAGATTWDGATLYIKINATSNAVSTRMNALQTQKASLLSYIGMKSKIDKSINALQSLVDSLTARQKEFITLIKELDLKFYNKYSRFIQEGSWKDEKYIDDNLYYLDAQSVAYTSSRPQVSYNISVLRLSRLEEFKNKIFRLGDIAFIQDTEFFGYTYINGVKTPYKEKILVSEITSYFDEPEKDTFKIQNYKTQFEDLFQRITSTTQSLKYASGEYARAAATIEPNGTINPETLQNSISLNEQLVYSAQNEAIITDSTGLTVADTTNPNKKTKITSGGIFITTDGGMTWKNAVRGEGIATQYLTTGSIVTNSINIMDGNFKAFRWDESGINAYYPLSGGGINLSKFVRFDHYGIYGLDNSDSDGNYTPESEDAIWNDAKFGMTWKGFFIKNKYETHYVEVSSTNDIQVVKGNTPVIKIGQLDSIKGVYGIRISDASGAPVMETNNDGDLWLKNRLNISSTTGKKFSIGIGYLSGIKDAGEEIIHEVFNANGKFIVYEDGSMKATDGYFEGTVHATDGDFTGIVHATGGEFTGTVHATSGEFTGTVHATDGDFTGTINATGGSFTGAINATEGSFTGNISASGGNIGGFIIQEDGLYSKYGAEETENGYDTTGSLIKLLGQAGLIEAEYINLGANAHINEHIKLGEAYLWNPEYSNPEGLILEAGAVKLSQTGELQLGDITLNGSESKIYGTSFSIKPDQANFSNINVSGKISTVVFEQAHLQSVGGSMMFKPSYKITSYTNNTLTLDETFLGNEGDYVSIVKESGSVIQGLIQIIAKNENIVTLSTSLQLGNGEKLVSLIDLGTNGDIIIGINSTNVESNYLKPRGITISEFQASMKKLLAKVKDTDTYVELMVIGEDGNHLSLTSNETINDSKNVKVFLGDLDKSDIGIIDQTKVKGFGLYSENVYLTGSLTTKVENSSKSTFAGVNTLNGAQATIFDTAKDNDTSKIVFWAGSKGTANDDIQNAPFQVTEGGSLYASQGIFEGAIITKSSIKGADIYAARIHGTGKEENKNSPYGLAFYDADDGLVFYRGDTEDTEQLPVEVFSIGTNGLKCNSKYFIQVNNNKVIFKGDEYYTDTKQSNFLHFISNQIFGSSINNNETEEVQANITFSKQKLSMGVGFTQNNEGITHNEDIVIDTNGIELKNEIVKMNKTVFFGEKLKYEQVDIGYNLYVL